MMPHDRVGRDLVAEARRRRSSTRSRRRRRLCVEVACERRLLRPASATSSAPASPCTRRAATAPRPWTTASRLAVVGRDLAHRACRRASACVLNVICVPPLKSMPRLRPRTPSEIDAGDDDRAGDREPQVPAPHEVDLQPLRRLLPVRAHEARVVEPAEAAEQAEHRARRRDRGEQRDQRCRSAASARSPSRAATAIEEQHERGDRGDDVRVEDGVEALAVAGRDGGAHGLPGRAPLP